MFTLKVSLMGNKTIQINRLKFIHNNIKSTLFSIYVIHIFLPESILNELLKINEKVKNNIYDV